MNFRRAFAPLLSLALFALGGCTLGNLHSIHREFDSRNGRSQLVDAQQRSVLVWHDRSDPDQRPIVCAEPSPDALVAYAASVAAQGSDPQSGASGSFNFASASAAANIGLRTQSIQLMRDAYYRACEAYMSQAIDAETYDTLIRRLNNQAVAYLAIEQITSGTAVAAQAAASPPDLKPLFDKLATAEATLTKATSDAKAAHTAVDNCSASPPAKDCADATKLPDLKTAAAKADQAQKDAKDAVSDANKAIADAAKPSVTGTASAATHPAPGESAAEAAEHIALAIVNADYSPQMCFAHVRRTCPECRKDPLDTYCTGILKANVDAYNAQIDEMKAQTAATTTRTQLMQRCMDAVKKTDAAALAKCKDGDANANAASGLAQQKPPVQQAEQAHQNRITSFQ